MEDKSNGEKIVLFIVFAIIIFVIAYVVYTIFTSNNNFFENNTNINNNENNLNNTTEDNETSKEHTTNTNTNTNTTNNTNVDNINIDKDKINIKPKETEIANFTSTLYDKDENRVFNIGLAISKLNGKIVKKDEEFSFNNTIGAMTEENGFKKAVGFDTNGNKIKVPGGGMCQISSTIYNAVLMANLEVTERHPHSRRVYYVPKDKDATIYYGSLDFKFKNTSEADIRIDASNTNTDVTIKLVKLENNI